MEEDQGNQQRMKLRLFKRRKGPLSSSIGSACTFYSSLKQDFHRKSKDFLDEAPDGWSRDDVTMKETRKYTFLIKNNKLTPFIAPYRRVFWTFEGFSFVFRGLPKPYKRPRNRATVIKLIWRKKTINFCYLNAVLVTFLTQC